MNKIMKIFALTLLVCMYGLPFVANAGEVGRAESYIGKKIYTDSEEYKKSGGFAFTDEKNRPLPSTGQPARQPKYLIAVILNRPNNSVFLITEGHNDPYGRVEWVLVHDAIDIPNGLRFIGSNEEPCKAKNYPLDTIFVAGKWANRKAKNGDYAGGYARSISKAWRVDFTLAKLIKISADGVSCEDSTQPGEID